jgi:hypothetical protein
MNAKRSALITASWTVAMPCGKPGIGLERSGAEDSCRQQAGVGDGHDLVVFPVYDQDRHIDGLEVVRESVSEKALMQA